MKLLEYLFPKGILLCIISCTTYTIPNAEFKSTFTSIPLDSLQEIEVIDPYGRISTYLSNVSLLDSIKVYNKEGEATYLRNSPSLETRITYLPGNKKIFYLDRFYTEDNKLVGFQSRLLPNLSKEISLDSITKVEIQKGRKNFQYVNE
jgi:hypothetical protein